MRVCAKLKHNICIVYHIDSQAQIHGIEMLAARRTTLFAQEIVIGKSIFEGHSDFIINNLNERQYA